MESIHGINAFMMILLICHAFSKVCKCLPVQRRPTMESMRRIKVLMRKPLALHQLLLISHAKVKYTCKTG